MAADSSGADWTGGGAAEAFITDADDLSAVRAEITAFVRDRVADAGARGVVVAMSGGLDSTLTATLAAEALGPDRVLGLGLPTSKADSHHVSDAWRVADDLGIEFRTVQLKPVLDAFERQVRPDADEWDRRTVGNLSARLRMACAYYTANTMSRLVVGTANRSELRLGYFTKYGDGAADCYPLGELYKTEVRALAAHAGVPERIVEKTPTAGFAADQTDADDLGAPYPVVDRLLHRLVVRGESTTAAAEAVGVPVSLAERIASRYADSAHKRSVPPTPGARDADGG